MPGLMSPARRSRALRLLLSVVVCALALMLCACGDEPAPDPEPFSCGDGAPEFFGPESCAALHRLDGITGGARLMALARSLAMLEVDNPVTAVDCLELDEYARGIAVIQRHEILNVIVPLAEDYTNGLSDRERDFWRAVKERVEAAGDPHGEQGCRTPEEAVRQYLAEHGRADVPYFGTCSSMPYPQTRDGFCTIGAPGDEAQVVASLRRVVPRDFPGATPPAHDLLLGFTPTRCAVSAMEEVCPPGYFQLARTEAGWTVRRLYAYDRPGSPLTGVG
jgi:hypothetical protein